MRSASGSKASRVRMGLLLDPAESLPGGGDSLAHAYRSCSSRHVVQCEDTFELDEIVEIPFEVRVNILQILEFEILQFAAPVKSQADGLSHPLMGNAERNAFARQVGRSGQRVHAAGLS